MSKYRPVLISTDEEGVKMAKKRSNEKRLLFHQQWVLVCSLRMRSASKARQQDFLAAGKPAVGNKGVNAICRYPTPVQDYGGSAIRRA